MSLTPTPALIDALNAVSDVQTHVPGRVWWGMADQSAVFPHVVVTLVDAENVDPCQGAQVGRLEAVYRVLAYAPMKSVAVDVLLDAATAVHNALLAMPRDTELDAWVVRRVRWLGLEERPIVESGEDRLQVVGGRYQLSLVEGA